MVTMWFLTLILAVSLMAEQLEKIECFSRDGYAIQLRYELVEKNIFDEKSLRDHFGALAFESLHGDIFLFVTPDRFVYEKFSALEKMMEDKPPQIGLSDLDGGPWYRFAEPSLPMAYGFKFGQDAFVQYRDKGGRVGWLLLSGSNLFAEALGGEEFTLVAYGPVAGYFRPCEQCLRSLSFVVPSLTREKARSAARFLHDRLPYPGSLSVDFFTSVEDALGMTTPNFPGLGLLNDFRDEMERRATAVIPSTDEEFREHVRKTPLQGKHWSFYRAEPDRRWFSVFEGPELAWQEELDW
jgi:hypothetical protein